MKKYILLMLVALSTSSCSLFKSSADWADNTFFGDDNPNQPNSNYPYYYSTMAAQPIDANEDKSAYMGGMPPAAPGSVAANQPYLQQAPAAPQAEQGGYGVQNNNPTTSVTYGNKGLAMKTIPQAPIQQAPAQISPPQYQAQPQYQPQQYQPQPYPQVAPQAPYQPYQPYHAPQAAPQAQAQPQPQDGQQPNPQDPYQQLFYGQQYAPQTYGGQYQYPPMPK